uniref:Uncharacterized protein n=1 Tax=Tetranychus urticae TaxID=32264 RepID=T1KIG8_TETUR
MVFAGVIIMLIIPHLWSCQATFASNSIITLNPAIGVLILNHILALILKSSNKIKHGCAIQ